jgi:hypothetical protein
MGNDEAALVRLWREKRGEAEPADLSGNLIVQLGWATEDLNRILSKMLPSSTRTPPRSGRVQFDRASSFPLSMQAKLTFTAISKVPPLGSLAVPVTGRAGYRFLQQH